MAFDVNTTTMAIDMHKGDTGSFWVQLELDNGEDFEQGDVAIFEVWQGTTRKMHREYELQPAEPDEKTPGDGLFLIEFENADTDQWAVTTYDTEIRVVLNPTRSSGSVTTGDTVRTVVQNKLNLRSVWIDI